jgi:hypothetical protein
MGFQMFNFKEWQLELMLEQDRLRREWREYEKSPRYKLEHQYNYPIGPRQTEEQLNKAILEMFQ